MNENWLRRQLVPLGQVGPHCIQAEGGRLLLNFSSNDYLGLRQDARVIEAACQAIRVWGTGSGASPLLSGYTQLHQQLAAFLTHWKTGNAESQSSALLFPCGYSANLGVLTALVRNGDRIYCDRKNHASILDAIRLVQATQSDVVVRYYRHRDYQHLEELLSEAANGGQSWIVTDSVFSMDGTVVDPNRLLLVAANWDAGLIVDEAHATGVCGQRGAGLFAVGDSEKLAADVRLIVVGTLSKALASQGGFVVASLQDVDAILQTARSLTYSTSLSPGNVAAAMKAGQIAWKQPELRQQLASHVGSLCHQLSSQGWQVTGDPQGPLLSVIVGTAENSLRASAFLREAGVYAPAIRPPTVKPNACRIRISPMASMKEMEIQQLADAFGSMSERHPEWRMTSS